LWIGGSQSHGSSRGASDFVPTETGTTAFYAFHPDEETLIRAALDLNLRSPLDPPLTAYGLLPMYMARAVLVGVESFDAGPAERQRIYPRLWSVVFIQHHGPAGDAFAPDEPGWAFLPELERTAADPVVGKTTGSP
jgi:hypothetical protein